MEEKVLKYWHYQELEENTYNKIMRNDEIDVFMNPSRRFPFFKFFRNRQQPFSSTNAL